MLDRSRIRVARPDSAFSLRGFGVGQLLVLFLGAALPAHAGNCDLSLAGSGQATWYVFEGQGTCALEPRPGEAFVAMNGVDWQGSQVCGQCLRVIGPAGEVTVRIVDRCPECPSGDIDLSTNAFEQIADLDLGIVPVSWHAIPCEPDGPVSLRFEGSNPWYLKLQIRDHRHGVSSVELLTPSQTLAFQRSDDNHFEGWGDFGGGPYSFGVRDVVRGEIVEQGILLQNGLIQKGSSQFSRCGTIFADGFESGTTELWAP